MCCVEIGKLTFLNVINLGRAIVSACIASALKVMDCDIISKVGLFLILGGILGCGGHLSYSGSI
jgi:hypothetical protein